MSSNLFSSKIVKIMDNVKKYGTAGQATDVSITEPICFACWISKSTETHSAYAIFTASLRQKWLHESASILRLHVNFLSFFNRKEYYSITKDFFLTCLMHVVIA
jgi:hypothetical protein